MTTPKLQDGTPKKVSLQLVGLDGNAYSLMGAFANQARAEGWTKDEIGSVMTACRSGDYSNLLCVLMDHCEDPVDADEDDERDEED